MKVRPFLFKYTTRSDNHTSFTETIQELLAHELFSITEAGRNRRNQETVGKNQNSELHKLAIQYVKLTNYIAD